MRTSTRGRTTDGRSRGHPAPTTREEASTSTTEPRREKRLLRVDEAARELGIGRSLAYQLIRTGRLRSIKIGSRRLVPRSAIDEAIARLLEEES
ncbi:helix-turn-helix domain-containing protein [Dactylosporangium sp. AC04546]|uniref:helix-turn-helix domain-containing protein n=1 Tax=Dactylosporangium sp. AC04546 TaxID=2862460 RepID=UPI002E7C5247|nr:helix-turn-helix domain-containing protein [Dactylosporangium sp. AC04546]WVK89799.1 helix-turn-helix domain-containing protein [Dactylosporangium sp. AC04546]